MSFDDGDREYADGELLEYNTGEIDHGDIQGLIYGWFFARRREFGVFPLVEVRTLVSPGRYRIPDVSVVRGPRPAGRVITEPALLAIERIVVDDGIFRIDDPAIEMNFAELTQSYSS
jgi:Uma2 family endonuclease